MNSEIHTLDILMWFSIINSVTPSFLSSVHGVLPSRAQLSIMYIFVNCPIKFIYATRISACDTSASSRISKEQGYQGFLRKRAGSSFGQKRAICVVQGKT
jgi:hypothetical protein